MARISRYSIYRELTCTLAPRSEIILNFCVHDPKGLNHSNNFAEDANFLDGQHPEIQLTQEIDMDASAA